MTRSASPYLVPVFIFEFFDRLIELRSTERRLWQIAVFGVPRLVSFQEQNVVPALTQTSNQRPVSDSMSITPGRSDRQPEYHDLHHQILPAAVRFPASIPSPAVRGVHKCVHSARA